MDWRDYELEIKSQIAEQFPKSNIFHNVRLKGRFSKVNRQVDILIEDLSPSKKTLIAIESKYYKRKIHAKDVEAFIGMLRDISVDKGIMVSYKGYTKGAINRAHYDPTNIQLDVLNLDELKEFQGFRAIPHTGKHGVLLPTPFGWIVDGTGYREVLACLYQRGATLEDAGRLKEWMYVNIRSKGNGIRCMEDLLKQQEDSVKADFPNAKITYEGITHRDDAKVVLRILDINGYPTKEYTGFVEFAEFIFFCVLYTPDELKEKNLGKLEYILGNVVPLHIHEEADS